MEAYLKKLCFEYQVEEKEVKELLARMERVYLDKGETIASATMPEQSLYIIVSGILHTFTTRQGEEKTVRFLSEGDAILCYNTSKHSVKTLTRCVAQYRENNHACIYFCDTRFFRGVMLRGTMEVLTDPASKEMIWQEGDTMYYPEGVTDPDYCVLKFTAISGRFYSNFKSESFTVE